MKTEGVKISGMVEMVLKDKNGNIKDRHTQRNLVVDNGYYNMTKLITGITTPAPAGTKVKALAIGYNGAEPLPPEPDDTDIPVSMTQSRKIAPAMAISIVDAKTWRMTATWGNDDPSIATITIWAIACYMEASGATLFSWIKRPAINKEPTDIFEITYTFTMS